MSLTAIIASWPTSAMLGNGASVGGSILGDPSSDFADMLAEPALLDVGNLLSAQSDYAVAFDAGMLLQSPNGPIAIADATSGVLPSLTDRASKSRAAAEPDVVARPSSISPIRTLPAQAGPASILQAAMASTQALSISATQIQTANSAANMAQLTGMAGASPGIEGEISSPIINESPALPAAPSLEISPPAEPATGWAEPEALTTSEQPARSASKNLQDAPADARLSVVDTAEGAVISYIAPQDASSPAKLKAIAESLMAEYAIPLGRLAYKTALLPLTAARGGGD